jgi:hypothetical protein
MGLVWVSWEMQFGKMKLLPLPRQQMGSFCKLEILMEEEGGRDGGGVRKDQLQYPHINLWVSSSPQQEREEVLTSQGQPA